MSLEETIQKLSASVEKLTAITEKLTSLRADAIETVKKEAASTTTTKTADKPKAEATPKEEPKADAVDPKHEKVRTAIADYIGEIDRENERAARKEKVKALLNHEKVKKPGIDSATSSDHIKDDAFDLFLDQIAKLKAKGALTTAPSDDLV